MLDKTSSIICAFGLASAAPRSPYRHLELCGIALKKQQARTAPLYAPAGLLLSYRRFDSRKDFFMSYTKLDLLQDLADMGLTGQETILIHSSMKSIGPVDGGADTVLNPQH
jgi:hypothetical protein